MLLGLLFGRASAKKIAIYKARKSQFIIDEIHRHEREHEQKTLTNIEVKRQKNIDNILLLGNIASQTSWQQRVLNERIAA